MIKSCLLFELLLVHGGVKKLQDVKVEFDLAWFDRCSLSCCVKHLI
jgi:hypothetical protein